MYITLAHSQKKKKIKQSITKVIPSKCFLCS